MLRNKQSRKIFDVNNNIKTRLTESLYRDLNKLEKNVGLQRSYLVRIALYEYFKNYYPEFLNSKMSKSNKAKMGRRKLFGSSYEMKVSISKSLELALVKIYQNVGVARTDVLRIALYDYLKYDHPEFKIHGENRKKLRKMIKR